MSEVVQQAGNTSPAIILTPSAIQHIATYLAKRPSSKGVRFSVKKSGCSGLSYVVDYVDAPEPTDLIMPLINTYSLYIDKKSYPFIKGLEVDYIQQGLNFKFVFNNPNQTGQCGCGESFTV